MTRRALSPNLAISALVSATVLYACVEDVPELSPEERRELSEYILDAAPEPEHAMEIQYGDRVRLIGYDTSADEITPGTPFTITFYWEVQRTMGGGWIQFTHVADGSGESRINRDEGNGIRQRYSARRWHAGEWIRDPVEVTVPADWGSDRAVFYLGFWREDDGARLDVTSGPEDGTDRGEAASIPVRAVAAEATAPAGGAAPTAPIPAMRAPHATGTITIDGVLDEADWAVGNGSGPFVSTLDGARAALGASARLLWDERGLYVGFEVPDAMLRSTYTERDDRLWEQDCVELLVDPDGNGRDYFEIQISPAGVFFDTHYGEPRDPAPIGHADWNADIEARVTTEGTLNDGAPDTRYVVEARIGWGSFAYPAGGTPPAAPAGGATWRMNLYAMDLMTGDSSRSSGWSATLVPDFHVPARFGRVTFEAAPEPPPPAATAPGTTGELRIAPVVIPPSVRAALRPEGAVPADRVIRPAPAAE